MSIYLIDPPGLDAPPASWHLDEETLRSLPTIDDYPRAAAGLAERARVLAQIPIDGLVGLLASFADAWLDRQPDELRALAPLGVAFALSSLRRTNLERLLRASLRASPAALDGFVTDSESGTLLAALPRGVVTHWVAGNVPVLGWLSVVQGLLSKNANVVKVPRHHGLLLPWLLRRLRAHNTRGPDGSVLAGAVVAGAVLPVYCPPDDAAGQRALSAASDARVVWGSREAVESVRALPAASHVEDIVFGPRQSIAVIGREALDRGAAEALARQVALDASYFDQRGCNSPHTVFVERGGAVSPGVFAATLARAMAKTLPRLPRSAVTPDEAFRIATARAEWAIRGEVHASAGLDWTVIVAEGQGLVDPVQGRVVFVRPVGHLNDVLPWITRRCQTIGLAASPERARDFAMSAASRGVDRIVQPGRMSLYDQPWDGLFLIDRLVRWVTADAWSDRSETGSIGR